MGALRNHQSPPWVRVYLDSFFFGNTQHTGEELGRGRKRGRERETTAWGGERKSRKEMEGNIQRGETTWE